MASSSRSSSSRSPSSSCVSYDAFADEQQAQVDAIRELLASTLAAAAITTELEQYPGSLDNEYIPLDEYRRLMMMNDDIMNEGKVLTEQDEAEITLTEVFPEDFNVTATASEVAAMEAETAEILTEIKAAANTTTTIITIIISDDDDDNEVPAPCRQRRLRRRPCRQPKRTRQIQSKRTRQIQDNTIIIISDDDEEEVSAPAAKRTRRC
jgi:hypothetical protein